VTKTLTKTKLTSKEVGLKYGFRSGLEEKVAAWLTARNVNFLYEKFKFEYTKPATKHTYTPDFVLDNGVIIETKGRWLVEDRKKHLLIKEQFPDYDVRILFQNAHTKISKTSHTTYADFCEKHGIIYANKVIPLDWLLEKPKQRGG
jgi:hypothetical protein